MRKKIVLIFLYASFFSCIKAQIVHINFFEANDVRNIITNCGYNEDSAICFLAHQMHKDSIFSSSVWYTESCVTGIPAEIKGYYGADKYAVSLKMKVFYWILQIFYEKYYSNPDTICMFLDEKKMPVMDMYLIDNKPRYTIDDIAIDSPVYHEYACPESESIESMFEEWMNKLNQYGLDYLRNHNIPPIRLEMWELCTCQNISTCNE